MQCQYVEQNFWDGLLARSQLLIQFLKGLVVVFDSLREHLNIGFAFSDIQGHDLRPRPMEVKCQVEDLLAQSLFVT